MNPWPFIIAAYAVTMLSTFGLGVWSWLAMRRAEHAVEALRDL